MIDKRITVEISKTEWVEVHLTDEGIILDVYEDNTLNSLATCSQTWVDLEICPTEL